MKWVFRISSLVLATSIVVHSGGRTPAAAGIRLAPKTDSSAQSKAESAYANPPLWFEANRGQTDASVKFLARGKGYTLFLTASETVLALHTPASSRSYGRDVVRMRLNGAKIDPMVQGLDLLSGHSSYLIGNDPRQWQTSVDRYSKVEVKQVYPGIDVVYYGNQRQLEYDFVVAPGANPQRIRMEFRGAKRLELDRRGNLVMSLNGGRLAFSAPKLYQQKGEVREPVEGRFVLASRRHVRFEVGAYDTSRELIIDPSLMYSTYLGGTVEDRVNAITLDSSGNVYLTGLTASASFPGSASGYQAAIAAGTDAFVTKISAAGAIVWSTYLGGNGTDIANAIAVDGSGIVHITGETTSTNFPTLSPYQAANAGGTDAFVAAINAAGTALIYSTYLGGAGEEHGYGIAADAAGNAYVTGDTASSAVTFPQTADAYQPAAGGASDAFVAKFSSAGGIGYSTFLGGTGADIGRAIAIDGIGNAYVTGQAAAAFPIFPAATVFKPTITGSADAFVSKLSSTGAGLPYSTYVGGSVIDDAFAIALDGTNPATLNIYITGHTYSADFPDIGFVTVGQTTIGTAPDAYVFKLNMNGGGGHLDGVYSTYLGASTDDRATAITVDSAGNTYVTGRTTSGDFPLMNPIQATNIGTGMAFVTEISSTGATKVFSTYLGGVTDQEGKGIGLDSSANIYVAGWTNSTDFSTFTAIQSANAGGYDGFVTKISAPSPIVSIAAPTGLAVADASTDQGFTLRLSWTANTESNLKDYGVYRSLSSGALGTKTLVAWVANPGTTQQDAGLVNGTTYYYQITARDVSLNESGGSSEASSIPYDNLAPATPTGLGVADVPADQGFALQLSWTANTEVDRKDYGLSRATFTGTLGTKALLTRVVDPGTTQQDAGLVNGTTYYYQLTARDISLNESGGSAEASAYPIDSLAPATPTGLGAADVPADQGFTLQLSWTANTESDLKDYGLYRATTTGGVDAAPTRILTPGTTHQAAGLTNGATYYYRLTARDGSLNESGYSSEVSAVAYDTLAPAAPSGLVAADVPADQGFALRLNWTANTETDVKDYRLYRSTTAGVTLTSGNLVATMAASGTTQQDAGLANGTTYYYQLTARDVSFNESGGSTETSAYPQDNLAPAAPSGLVVADVPADQGFSLRLNWTANTENDLKDYGLYRATSAGGVDAAPTRILTPGTTQQDAGLANGTTYYYRLTARDVSLNESGGSAEVSSIPYDNLAPAVPTGLAAVDVPSDQGFALQLSWTANTEADRKDYGLYRATFTGSLGTKALVTRVADPGTTQQDAGLVNGATYYYQLTARDVLLNESGGSAETSAYPQDNLAPGTPTGLGVADVPADQGFALRLSWTANTESDLKDYGLYRATTTGGVDAAPTRILTPGTTHQAAGLTNGVTYYYRLTARDVLLNESGGSAEVSSTPYDNLAPATPSGLGVADVPSDQGFALQLSWTANTESDLKDYRLWRTTGSPVGIGGAFSPAATIATAGTTYQDVGLANGATYYYRLTARDVSFNESGGAVETSAYPQDNLAPATPTGLAVADVPADQGFALQLSWTANTETDRKDYGVYRALASGALGTKTLIARVNDPGTTQQDGGLVNGTTYYYQLTARDVLLNESGGSAEASAYPIDSLAPAAPTGLGVADVPADQGFALQLSWTANTEADFKDYRLYRSTTAGVTPASGNLVATMAASGTTQQDGGLVNGTTYYYRLTARDISFNESGGSSEASSIPYDNLAPAVPAGLGVADVPADQGFALRLSWTANTEADRKDYGLYRATFTGSLGTKALLTRVADPGTTQQDAGLVNGATYYYQLTTRDVLLNESGGSSEASSIPYDNLAPAAPTGLGVADVAGDQGFALQLSWTANTESDLKDYGVYRATTAGGVDAAPTRILTPGTTHQAAGLTNGTTYYYRLTARDASLNESGGSVEASAYPIDNLAPATPAGLGVADVPADQGFALRLSWTANTEADRKDYSLYRATFTGSLGTKALLTRVADPGTTQQDAGLVNGTTYYYQLTARDISLNESGGSAEASAYPIDNLAPAVPTGLAAVDVPSDQGFTLQLSWTANTESDLKDYGLYRATTTGGVDAAPTRILTPGTTHQAAGLTNGATYYYRLTARDVSLNESGLSAEASSIPYDNTAPAAPTGLAAADVAGDQGFTLRLNWTANTETDRKDYGVYRALSSGALGTKMLITRVTDPGTTQQDAGLVNGTTYYYQLTTRDVLLNESGGSAEASACPIDNLAPAVPAGLGVADVPADQGFALRLNWTANTESDLKDYTLYRATITPVVVGATFQVARVATPGTTYQDAGLANGTTYYYRLTARDVSFNESGGSVETSAYPQDNLAPAAPAGLGVADVPADQGFALQLSWTANTESDLKDYRVRRATFVGGATGAPGWATITIPGTTYQDGSLVNGTTYYYQITARDVLLNESGGSAETSAYPQDNLAPAVPTGLGVADVPSDQGFALRLNWTTNSEPDLKDFRLYRSTTVGVTLTPGNLVATVAAAGTTHQAAGLANGTTYYYQLTARDVLLNESGGSVETSAYPQDNLAPATPTGLGVADVPADQGFTLRLSWTANTESDLKDYRVRRATFVGGATGAPVLATIAIPGTTQQDVGLVNGTTYYYQLTARDISLNESGGSAEAGAYPIDNMAPAAPAGLVVADVPADQGFALRLNWTANTEPDRKDYGVYRALASGALGTKTLIARVNDPGTTHQDVGLANGTTYYYQLTTRDVLLNESGGSAEVSSIPYDNLAPAAPAGLGVADVPSDQGFALRLNWTANTETDRKDYGLYRALASGALGTKTLIARVNDPGTTHQDAGLNNGTTYYYQLTTRDISLNESGGSAEASAYPIDNLAPTVPTGLGVADVPSDQGFALRLSWTANTEADLKDYRVRRSTFAGGAAGSVVWAVVAAPGTTQQDSGLVNGTTYYYQLTTRDMSLNESGGSVEVSSIPYDNLVPAAPSGLVVADVPADQGFALRLNWTANTETDRKDYGVYRALSSGALGTKTLITRVMDPGTTQQDAGLVNGTTYYYQITARDVLLNESGGSAETSAYPQDNLAPAAPAGLVVADVPADQGFALRLTWTANTETDRKDYGVYRALASGALGTKTLIARVNDPGTTQQDGGLVNGTTYYYQFTARDVLLNESGGSVETSASPQDNLAPATPAGLGATFSTAASRRNLSWSANTESDLKDYRVYRSTSLGVTIASSHLIASVASPGTTHQDAGLTTGTTYYYRLTARDAGLNESGGSTEVSGAPPLIAAPAGLGVADPGTGPLNLSWTANTETDLKDYRLYRSINSGVTLVSSHVVAAVAAPGTTHQDGGLTAGTRYHYRLAARDVSLNESGGSGEVAGQPGPPAAPTGLGVADAGTGGALNLVWAANLEFDLKEYRLYRSTTGNVTAGSTWTVVAGVVSVPGTTSQDGGLVNATMYYYRLSARDTGLNESPLSGSGSAVPTAPTSVLTPLPPSAPPTTSVTATVSISASMGGSTEMKTALEPGTATRIDGDALTLNGTGAAPGNTIEARIVNQQTNITQTVSVPVNAPGNTPGVTNANRQMNGAQSVSVPVDAPGNWSLPTPKLADGTYDIQVRQVDPQGRSSAWSPERPFVVIVDAVPDQTVAIPAGPNPFRPGRGGTMAVGFELQSAAEVTVSIHTQDGKVVRTLMEGRALSPGRYERSPAGDASAGWDGTNESGQVVSSGIYLCRIQIGDRVYSRRVIVIR